MSAKSPLSIFIFLGLAVSLACPAAAGDWARVGPNPDYSMTYPVFTDPRAPGTVWAGCYKSIDRGITWSGPVQSEIEPVAFDVSAPGAMWAATRTVFLHTRGDGAPWEPVPSLNYSALFADPNLRDDMPAKLLTVDGAPETLYLRTYRRVLGSLDRGVTWQTVLDVGEGQQLGYVAVAATSSLYVTVIDNDGIVHLVKTNNDGHTWTPVEFPATDAGIYQIAVGQGAVFIASNAGLHRSLDGGLSWRDVLQGTSSDSAAVNSVFIDPQVPGTVWASMGFPSVLWLSRDKGETWTRRGSVIGDPVAAGPEPSTLYASYHDDGIARSINGGRTWNATFPAYHAPDRPPSRIAFQPGRPSRLAFVVGHKLFRSDDGGRSWRWVSTAPDFINDVAFDPADPKRMIAVGYSGAATTTNDGRTWWRSRSYPDAELLVRANGKTLFAGGCGVSRSRDNGKTWTQVLSCSSPRDRDTAQIVQKLEVDPGHPDLIHALTFLDDDFYPNHGPYHGGRPSILWQSRNGGRTWQKIALDLDAFAYDSESSRLWILSGADLLASDDGGATWQFMARVPVGDDLGFDLAVPPGLPGTLYLSGDPGLLRSQDNGKTWERMGPSTDGLLALSPGDPRAVFSMSHRGLFHLRLPD